VRRDTAPSREAGQDPTGAAADCFGIDGEQNASRESIGTLRSHPSGGYEGARVAICMAHGQAGAEIRSEGSPSLTCNHEAPIVAFHVNAQPDQMNFSTTTTAALTASQNAGVLTQYGPLAGSLTARHDSSPCADRGMNVVAFAQNTRDEVREMAVVGALAAEPGMKQTSYIRQEMQVRRLTPTECERLQGFPDGYTNIPGAADGPRYKSLGNSMAVPVMNWIGRRLQCVI
jgi:site-specific DNA-cytosine methylase